MGWGEGWRGDRGWQAWLGGGRRGGWGPPGGGGGWGGGGEKNPNKTTANTLGLFLYIHLTGWVKQEKDHRECCAGWCPGGSPWRNCPPSPTSLPPMCRKPSALGCYILPLTSTMVFRTRIPEISVYLFTFRIWSEKKIIYRIRSVDGAAALWFPGSPSVKGQCQKSRYGR